MKIIAINGSPKGKDSNTNVIVTSFLKGAQEAGAEIRNIFLSEKEIKHCNGCHICWTKGPGQCVINDDMLQVLTLMGEANIIIFVSPIYFGNISGMLKTFMDRMTMIGGPQLAAETMKERQSKESIENIPKLMMVSSCGLQEENEFDVTSLWINKVAKKVNMELIGEIYATNGKAFHAPPETLDSTIANYLQLVEIAGRELVKEGKLSDKTKNTIKKAGLLC